MYLAYCFFANSSGYPEVCRVVFSISQDKGPSDLEAADKEKQKAISNNA